MVVTVTGYLGFVGVTGHRAAVTRRWEMTACVRYSGGGVDNGLTSDKLVTSADMKLRAGHSEHRQTWTDMLHVDKFLRAYATRGSSGTF